MSKTSHHKDHHKNKNVDIVISNTQTTVDIEQLTQQIISPVLSARSNMSKKLQEIQI